MSAAHFFYFLRGVISLGARPSFTHFPVTCLYVRFTDYFHSFILINSFFHSVKYKTNTIMMISKFEQSESTAADSGVIFQTLHLATMYFAQRDQFLLFHLVNCTTKKN